MQPEDLKAHEYQFWGFDKWAPYLDSLDSLEPLGLRCCVVCGVMGWDS